MIHNYQCDPILQYKESSTALPLWRQSKYKYRELQPCIFISYLDLFQTIFPEMVLH